MNRDQRDRDTRDPEDLAVYSDNSVGTLSESTLDGDPSGETPGSAAVACLTIACTPEISRIGERALLTRLLAGKAVEVARNSLEFARPGSSDARPLTDPYLSRQPLKLARGRGGAVTIDASEAPCTVDGKPLVGSRTVEREELERGVHLQLSPRVSLLLHSATFLAPQVIEPLLGWSDAIERVRQQIKRVAPFEMPVLIRGETGVGKELAARALHESSRRADKPCVAVNMATLNANTAHSTLFGHVRGAFTGASERRVGLFEQANGGTLFLDEVGETPDSVQPMLLRVLETGCFTPLGASRELSVDVRVVAATDAALEASVQTGDFRSALLHRLSGYELLVPPLRARRSDIPLLFVHLLGKELESAGARAWLDTAKDPKLARIPSAVMALLLSYEFPGNVRELRNLARHLLVSSAGKEHLVIDPAVSELMATRVSRSESNLPPARRINTPSDLMRPARSEPAASPAAGDLDAETILAALRANDFVPKRAAEALGIPNSTLHYLMQKTHLSRRASDLTREEIAAALAANANDIEATAMALQVSARALSMAARRFGLIE